MRPLSIAQCVRPFLGKLAGSKTKFQVLSDLRLDYCSQYSTFHIPVCAPYLILAGNIGRLKDYELYLNFLVNASLRFELIFLVLGAQEFFGLTRHDGLIFASRLQREPALEGKLWIMDRTTVNVTPSISILGCTLFSQLRPKEFDAVTLQVNDFAFIKNWTASDHALAHQTDVGWLQREIGRIRVMYGSQHKILVVTNHAPIYLDAFRTRGKKAAEILVDETQLLEGGSEFDMVDGWIFGRGDVSLDQQVGRVHLVSNQRGIVMPFEDGNTSRTRDVNPFWRERHHRKKQESSFDVTCTIRM